MRHHWISCCIGLVFLGVYYSQPTGNGNDACQENSNRSTLAAPQEPTIQAELQERRLAYVEELKNVVKVAKRRYEDGTESIEELIRAQIALAKGELAATKNPAERLNKLENVLQHLKEMESIAKQRFTIGAARVEELHQSKAARIYGEIMLLEERERQND